MIDPPVSPLPGACPVQLRKDKPSDLFGEHPALLGGKQGAPPVRMQLEQTNGFAGLGKCIPPQPPIRSAEGKHLI